MSDQPSSPRRPRPEGPSAQSKWIGFVVLGFGVVAVVAVLILALGQKEQTSSLPGPEAATPVPVAESSSPAPSKHAPAASYARQQDIQESEITGAWQTLLQGGKAVVALEKGTFRLIVVFNTNIERRYLNGTYKLTGDILLLTPLSDIPAPQDGYSYRPLTLSEFPLLVSKHKGKMVWQNPKPEQAPAGMFVPSVSPFLTLTDSNVAVWDKLK